MASNGIKNHQRHKDGRAKARPNAQSVENVLDILGRLRGHLDALAPSRRPALRNLLDEVTAWATAKRDARVAPNMGLVGQWVQKYRARLLAAGYTLDDGMQEGTIGLLRAAEMYDEALGWQFSTYATWWIRQGIGRLLVKSGLIRVPDYLFVMAEEKVAGLSPKNRQRRELALELRNVWSLNLQGGEDGGEFGRSCPDPKERFKQEHADARMDLAELLRCLPQRERRVIELHRLDGLTLEDTAEQLAAEMGEEPVTRERIRQIESRAVAKMRWWAKERLGKQEDTSDGTA